MKKNYIYVASALAFATIVISSCNPLKKMAKKADTVSYEVVPNPLEMHGDSIAISISGKYPEKYFHKKATVIATPTMTWTGGSKEFKPVTLLGESAEGEGTKISFSGGSFTYNDKIEYVKGIETAEIKLKAEGKFKTKSKDLSDLTIGYGTKVTPLLVQSDEKPLIGADKFTKIIPRSVALDINYELQQSTVRPNELKQDDYKAFQAFLKEGIEKEFTFKGVTISAYASPDGELTLNENLANDRAKTATKAIEAELKKMKIEAGKEASFYNAVGKGEDWDGFKAEVEKTTHPDKDLILRVLQMTADPAKRELEIKNMAATYTFLAKEVLPKQRRANITVNAEEKSKTDEQIADLAKNNPEGLTVEELLYAATLTNDLNEKLAIYQSAAKIYADDWRGHNNAGYIYLVQNKLNEAEASLNKAIQVSPNNSVVNNNLGIVARWKGDRKKAEELYKSAASAGKEVNYNLGIINIMNGDYGAAVSNFGGETTYNAALAKLLNADNDGALKTINAAEEGNSAEGYYLKAIIGARSKNLELMVTNLRTAIEKDAALKDRAKGDAEFINYKEDEGFKGLVN
jgi:tetratricopeptide (TPR) repeat protein/Tfp pilus assembly major pilin PilA